MTQTLKNFLLKLVNDYRQSREINETIRELQKLTNKELNDIGLSHESHTNKNLRGWV